jgi:hypothetical protein
MGSHPYRKRAQLAYAAFIGFAFTLNGSNNRPLTSICKVKTSCCLFLFVCAVRIRAAGCSTHLRDLRRLLAISMRIADPRRGLEQGVPCRTNGALRKIAAPQTVILSEDVCCPSRRNQIAAGFHLLVCRSLRWFIANLFALDLHHRAHMPRAPRRSAILADRQPIHWPRTAHATFQMPHTCSTLPYCSHVPHQLPGSRHGSSNVPSASITMA